VYYFYVAAEQNNNVRRALDLAECTGGNRCNTNIMVNQFNFTTHALFGAASVFADECIAAADDNADLFIYVVCGSTNRVVSNPTGNFISEILPGFICVSANNCAALECKTARSSIFHSIFKKVHKHFFKPDISESFITNFNFGKRTQQYFADLINAGNI